MYNVCDRERGSRRGMHMKRGTNMLRDKRLASVDRFTHTGVVLVNRHRTVNGVRVRRITDHRNVTPASYTRLRMTILAMVAHGNGFIQIWPVDAPDMLRGWTYYAI